MSSTVKARDNRHTLRYSKISLNRRKFLFVFLLCCCFILFLFYCWWFHCEGCQTLEQVVRTGYDVPVIVVIHIFLGQPWLACCFALGWYPQNWGLLNLSTVCSFKHHIEKGHKTSLECLKEGYKDSGWSGGKDIWGVAEVPWFVQSREDGLHLYPVVAYNFLRRGAEVQELIYCLWWSAARHKGMAWNCISVCLGWMFGKSSLPEGDWVCKKLLRKAVQNSRSI